MKAIVQKKIKVYVMFYRKHCLRKKTIQNITTLYSVSHGQTKALLWRSMQCTFFIKEESESISLALMYLHWESLVLSSAFQEVVVRWTIEKGPWSMFRLNDCSILPFCKENVYMNIILNAIHWFHVKELHNFHVKILYKMNHVNLLHSSIFFKKSSFSFSSSSVHLSLTTSFLYF